MSSFPGTRQSAIGLAGAMLVWSCLALAGATSAFGQDESPPEAVDLYNTAVNAQNDGDFDAANAFWDEFQERFPDDPLAARAHHYSGTCKLQLGRYDEAAAQFETVLADYPNLEMLEETYLNLAWCQYSLAQAGEGGDYAKAAETFATLAEKYPEGSHAAEARFFQGESLYLAGNAEEALAAYQQALEADPSAELKAKVLYALGSTEQELGQNAEALATFETFLADYGDHALATDVVLGQAHGIMDTGEFARAEEIFAQVAAIEGFAQADLALYQQAHCAAQQEKHAEAAELFARVAEQYPDSNYAASAASAAGTSYYQAKDYEQAEPWLARAAEQGGETGVEAAHWLCQAYLLTDRPQQALDTATAALGSAGEAPYAANLAIDRADALDALDGRGEEALAAYREIVAKYPESSLAPQARYNAAFTAMSLGQFAAGQADAEQFLADYPEHALTSDVKYVQAECLREQAKPAEAEAIYAELVSGSPDHVDHALWQVRLALVKFLQQKYAETAELLEPIADSLADPASKAEAQYLLGASRFYQDDYTGAIAALGEVVALDPQGPQADDALLFLSRSQEKLGQLDEARAAAQRLLAEYPESPLTVEANYRLGEYAYTAEDLPAALAAYETVIAGGGDSPFVPYALRGRGWTLIKQNNFADAEAAFTQLVDSFPEHDLAPVAHRLRAVCRERQGEWQGAIDDVDAYLAARPQAADKVQALYLKGLAQVGLTDYPAAVATFQQILPADAAAPLAADILYQLAWAQQEAGDSAAAVELFARLATEHPDDTRAAEANYHVGQSLYDAEKYAEAIAAYTQAKEQAAGDPLAEKAAYKLGWSHYQLKQYDDALADFTWQVSNFPAGSLAPSGKFMQAECNFELEKYPESLAVYQQLRDAPPADEVSQALILLHAGQCANQGEDWQAAIEWLTPFTERFPDSVYLPQAQFELARAKQNQEDYDAALELFESVATQRSDLGAQARFMIGEIHFLQHDYAGAIRQFQRVIYGFSGVEGVGTWQAKCAVDAGRCETLLASQAEGQQREEHIEQARKFFQYVIDKHPGTDEAAAASGQLERLGG